MNILTIILGVIVILLAYFLYNKYLTNPNALTTSQLDLKQTNANIPFANFTSGYSTQYAYGAWVYVNSWNTNNYKTLMSRGGIYNPTNNTTTDITLQLDKTTPDLYMYIGIQGVAMPHKIKITNNFPIQTWVYVVISVDNQIVDAYINGKFVLSTKLPNLPVVSSSDISIGDSTFPDIFMMGFTRWAYPLDPQTVWTDYLKGNGKGGSNFNMVITTYQNNVEQSQFSMF